MKNLALLLVGYGGISNGALGFQITHMSRGSRILHQSIPSTPATTSSSDEIKQRTTLLDQVLRLGYELGPVGVYSSSERQEKLLELARQLEPFSDEEPARAPLRGVHSLIYSAAPGGSSGKLLGPIHGRVTQEFVDETVFINAVELGPLKISLQAERKAKTDEICTVSFRKSVVELFGKKVVEKDIGDGGSWKYIFAGEATDPETNQPVYVRVMETPSLFLLKAPIK